MLDLWVTINVSFLFYKMVTSLILLYCIILGIFYQFDGLPINRKLLKFESEISRNFQISYLDVNNVKVDNFCVLGYFFPITLVSVSRNKILPRPNTRKGMQKQNSINCL